MIVIAETYGGNILVPPPLPNHRKYGVPVGGPADPVLAAFAMRLSKSPCVIEVATPLSLAADEPVCIAVASLPGSQTVASRPALSVGLVSINPGEPLEILAPKTGFRTYLSWPGFRVDSKTARALVPGQSLPCNSTITETLALDPRLVTLPYPVLRYLPLGGFGAIEAIISPAISRIGTRITPNTELPALPPLARSEPSLPGAIQQTPNGQLLIHGPDGPTLGGYPKFGVVISADLPNLARLRPGQAVMLQPVTQREAALVREESRRQTDAALAKIDNALLIAGFAP